MHTKRNLSKLDSDVEAERVNEYVRKKIADMKQGSRSEYIFSYFKILNARIIIKEKLNYNAHAGRLNISK